MKYGLDSFKQFNRNLVDFWKSTNGIGPELVHIAIRIHGICINSASVKRLWSILAMSQIRSEILYTHKVNEARECDHEMQRLHIAAPIISDGEEPNEEIEDLELNYVDNESDYRETDIQVSDDEDEINIRNETNNDEEETDIRNEINNDDGELNSEEQRLTH
ncbi:10882_t:CDS:2 [Diversispora eburnea]|uniref:10882_t:CDS:1 n=1 Tax=Diversispora eburnea TaxID=1213867 RepID=A0A9N9GBU6_9GLOM|nr:10882_t:CDS:2 [Diversispora eburnea]